MIKWITTIVFLMLTLAACQKEEPQPIEFILSENPKLQQLQEKMHHTYQAFLTHYPQGKQTHKNTIHTLTSGDYAEIVVKFDANEPYFIYGHCGENCYDIDLSLSEDDMPETILLEDVKENNVPSLEFTPTQTALYRIRVKMEHCQAPECYYSVQIFSAKAIGFEENITMPKTIVSNVAETSNQNTSEPSVKLDKAPTNE